jgi:hypothetical protein
MALEGALAGVPGLRGYLAGEDRLDRQVSQRQAQAIGLMGMLQRQQDLEQDAQLAPLRMQMMQAQVSDVRRKEDQAKALDQAISSLPPEIQAAARMNPQGFASSFFKESRPTVVPSGGAIFQDGRIVASNPKPEVPTELDRLLSSAGITDPAMRQKIYLDALNKKTTHAPAASTNISVSTEKKYGEQFGAKVAEGDIALREAAGKAPELADRANRVRQVLGSGKVITGAGADVRLAVGRALGLAGASDPELVANTETLMGDLAKNTLDAIKASGLGSGNGFSNADRDFLEKAVLGKITFSAEGLNRAAALAHRAAEQSAKKWTTRAREIPRSAIEGTGVNTEPVNVSPLAPGTVGGPRPGQVIDGYRFKGGNPAQQSSWEKQ